MEFSAKLLLRIVFGLVWLINGLFCKLLNIVPRHQQIVARVLGHEWAPFFTQVIGIAEIGMAIWIFSRWKPRVCAVFQMLAIGVMNIIEINVAVDLLLFGPLNIVIAGAFIFLIYIHTFVMKEGRTRILHRS